MSRDNRALGLQLTLCLALCIFSDGFIQGFQMSKVKIQLTDTAYSSLIRRNILHSETISNRPSSSLLAKQPAEPAFQEENNEGDSPVQKSRTKNQNVVHKSGPRKSIERSVNSNSAVNANEEKVKRDLENLQLQDQVARQTNRKNDSRKTFTDVGSFLVRLRQALEEGQLRAFVKILKSLAMEGATNLSLTEIIPLLERVVISELDSSMTADMIWSLGKLNLVVQNYEHKNVLTALMNRFCEHEELSPREVTTSLVGFSKLRFRWNYLSEENRNDIILAVGQVASTLNDREVGNLLHSLSKLAVPWSVFPKPLQNDLLESFIRVSKLLVSQQGSMAVYSLGLMGVTLDNVTPAVRDHIFVVALSVLEESKVHVHPSVTQQASNVIYGLAKMGVRYKSLPPYVSSGIEDGILHTMKSMNEQEISNTIYSLGLMGAKWNEFSPSVRNTLKNTVVSRFSRMITQGVSNIIYGMGLMGADWHNMGTDYTEAAQAAVVASFGVAVQRRGGGGGGGSAQAVANVIYSLGISGAMWEEFPPKVQTALMDALIEWGPELTSQEISNLCYGLGLMRANYHTLPPKAIEALELHYDRMKLIMNEQEVCSTLHGFAKMSARWDELSDAMRRSMLVSIASLSSVGALCLACTIYSLGMLGATWDRLPYKIRDSFMLSATQRHMQDQTISNVIYGLSLLKASWATLEPEFREVLLKNLAQENAFLADISQHIANTIWGLAKMDASWDLIPGKNLEKALIRAAKHLTPQETSNALYGLAVMDASWTSLSVETHTALCDSLTRTISSMTNQETANVMYSLALMTYDAPYGVTPNSVKTPEQIKIHTQSMKALWSIHRLVLENFKDINPADYNKENYDQYGMFFELMRVIPGGNKLVMDVLNRLPRTTGPCGGVPSRLHAKTVHAMMRNLDEIRPGFGVMHEFSGLHGVFPVDSAVYFNDNLVALVEIDGEFHYKQLGQLLRRKDKMKEFLYKYHYPTLPLFRIRSDQCTVIGVQRAGKELACWISSLVAAKESESLSSTK